MKKQPSFYYTACKEKKGVWTTDARSKADSGIPLKQFSEVNELVFNMMKEKSAAFEALGFDPATIKFQISIKTPE